MAASREARREARLDAQLARYSAKRLVEYLGSNPRPRVSHFKSVSRVLEAREAKASAVKAQHAFLFGVLRGEDADERAWNSARLQTIPEVDEPSEIHATGVVPDETGTADLGIATLSSKSIQAPPVQQLVLREKDVPFKKRKSAVVVEYDDEIVHLQRIQEDVLEEGDLANGSSVPATRKRKGGDSLDLKKRRKCAALVVHDEIVPVLPIQITASPKICDKPGRSSQSSNDPALFLEEGVQEEGDLAHRCATISLKRKADALDDNEVGEDVVARIQISKGPDEETMVATGVAPPIKKSKVAVVQGNDDEVLPLQPIKDSGLVQEEEVQEGNIADPVDENLVGEDTVPPIQISNGPEEELMVAMEIAPPAVGETQDPSDVQTWELSSSDSQSPLRSVGATESKNGKALVEEENREPPVSPTSLDLEENREKGDIVIGQPSEELAHQGIVSQAPSTVIELVQKDEQEIMEEVEISELVQKDEQEIMEENGEMGEAMQEEAEEPAHMGIVSPIPTTMVVVVQDDQQEIMNEEETDTLSNMSSDEEETDTSQLEQTIDRVTVSKRGRGRGRGRGRWSSKIQKKKTGAGESSRVRENCEEPPVASAGLEEDADEGERGLPSEATQETEHLVDLEIMEEEDSRVGVLYPAGGSLVVVTPIDMSSSGAPPQLEVEQTSDRVTVTKRGRGRGRGRRGRPLWGKKQKQKKKTDAAGGSSRNGGGGRGRGCGRGRGRGRGRSTGEKPEQAASSSEGCRCWLVTFSRPHEDGWLQRLLTHDDKSSEGGRDNGSTTSSSALTVLASASLMVAAEDDSATEWLRYSQVENNSVGERNGSMGEEGNAASALSLLASAAFMFTDETGTRNDSLTVEECSATTNLKKGMGANINGEGTSHDGGDGRAGSCTEGASQGNR